MIASAWGVRLGFAVGTPARTTDVSYAPNTTDGVGGMRKRADVTSPETVSDLGCGDGRIVLEAAKLRGARGVGVDDGVRQKAAGGLQPGPADRVGGVPRGVVVAVRAPFEPGRRDPGELERLVIARAISGVRIAWSEVLGALLLR